MLEKIREQRAILQDHIGAHKESQMQKPCSPLGQSTPDQHIRKAITEIIGDHFENSPNESATQSPFLSAVKAEITRSITELLLGESPLYQSATSLKNIPTYESPMAEILKMRRRKDLTDCAQQLMFDDATLREEQIQVDLCASEIPSGDSGYSSIDSIDSQGHSSSSNMTTSTPKTKTSKRRSLAKQIKRIGRKINKNGFKNLNLDLLAVL